MQRTLEELAATKVDGALISWLIGESTKVTSRTTAARLTTIYRTAPADLQKLYETEWPESTATPEQVDELIALAFTDEAVSPLENSAALRALAALGRVAEERQTELIASHLRRRGEKVPLEGIVVLARTAQDADLAYGLLTRSDGDRIPGTPEAIRLGLAALAGAPTLSRGPGNLLRISLLAGVNGATPDRAEHAREQRYLIWRALARSAPSGKPDFADFLRRNQTERIQIEIGREPPRMAQLLTDYSALGSDGDAWRSALQALRQHLDVEFARHTGQAKKWWKDSWQDLTRRRVTELLGI